MSTLRQIPLPRLIYYHFYVGFLITGFYIMVTPNIIELGFPSHTVLLMAELCILLPVVGGHMWYASKKLGGFSYFIPNRQRMKWKQFVIWTIGGFVAALLIYVPLYPVGIYLRESVFYWLPEWYFNPGYGTDNLKLIARVFLAGIFIDGFVGPIVEELFFRGYLLPRMAYLKKWAPILNGLMFGAYHFWQPHNLIAICGLGILLSWIVWKTNNVYLGIAIHCSLNIIGAVGGYLSLENGIMIDR